MNNFLKILMLIIIFAEFYSCEQTIDYELPYKPKIVVNGIMTSGVSFDTIEIYKTLPPLATFSFDDAKITNAQVVITDENGEKFTGTYSGFVSYQLDKPIIPQPGQNYTINVSWNGLNCSGETIIPDSVELGDLSLYYDPDDYYSARVAIKPNGYDCFYQSYYNDYGYYYDFDSKTNRDTAADGNLYLSFTNLYLPYNDTTNWKDAIQTYYIEVMTYDIQFLNYFLTRKDGMLEDDFFSNSGKNSKWNIKGDGIGLFIGRTRSSKMLK